MKSNLCISCGKPLSLGKFAYNQEMCWDCFEQKVISISEMTRCTEDNAIVIYLLDITKVAHNIK